jgi:hypothetical protein
MTLENSEASPLAEVDALSNELDYISDIIEKKEVKENDIVPFKDTSPCEELHGKAEPPTSLQNMVNSFITR